MSYKSMKLRITGGVPLLMHRGGLADPLDVFAKKMKALTGKRDKTEADLEEISRTEWYGGLYLDQGKPCIPGEVLEAAMMVAARKTKRGKQAQAGLLCPNNFQLVYDGPSSLEELWANPSFRLTTGVRVQRNRVMRTRPRFANWSLSVEVQYDPSMLNADEVLAIAKKCGEEVGLGDWRPKFGRFTVDKIE